MIFSIIITTFNYDKYIKQALNSAISQDFNGDYEIIVVDDFSSDNTNLILDTYHNIIRIDNNSNQGIEISANKAINLAKGKYIVRLDADDYFASNFLSEIYKCLNNKDTFYYGGYTIVSEDNDILSTVSLPEFDSYEIKSRGDFLASGTVYLRQALLMVGLYDDKEVNCGLENYDLILKLLQDGCSGKYINKNLFYYRRHHKNLSHTKKQSIINYGKKLAKKHHLDAYKINEYHPYLNNNIDSEINK